MGRWSTTIMGGDGPLDIECEIYNVCETEQFPDDQNEQQKIDKAILASKQMEILKNVQIADCSDEGDLPMVLAVMLMEVGAIIHPEVKKKALESAENDEWSKSDSERAKHVREFAEALEEYDNKTPTVITKEGLFQKLLENEN